MQKQGCTERYKLDKTPFFHYILFVQADKTQLSPVGRQQKKSVCAIWREPLPEAAQQPPADI